MKIRASIVAILFALSLPAAAQTLYKLIDKKGKVTYVDTPPKDFDGQVIPVDIDTKRNSATITTPGTAQGARAFDQRNAAAEQADARRKAAESRLEAAKKNLANARENPQEGEVTRVGNVGGGSRPVYSDEYQKRIAALEAEVRAAEEEVKQAQKGR